MSPLAADSSGASLAEGVERFNAQRWWDAHESWETAWLKRAGLAKTHLQGLIQSVACFYLLEELRDDPARRLAASALAKLVFAAEAEGTETVEIDAPGLIVLLEAIGQGLPGDQALERAARLRVSLRVPTIGQA